MAFQQVNVGAAADDGTGDPLRPAFQKLNANTTETQVQLATKADAQETSEALNNQQGQIDSKANQTSLTELTQRVQDNTTAIGNVKNATTPAALSGSGLKASTDGTKIDVNHGDGLTVDSNGALVVDPDLIDSVNGKADQEALQAVAETVGDNTSRIQSLEDSAVDAVDLAGPGLKAQDGKLTPNIGAGLEVSTSNLLQLAADFVATVNGKADEETVLAVAEVVGNMQTSKVDVSAKATSADIQNGVVDVWVDPAGLAASRVAFCATCATAQSIPVNATTQVTGMTQIDFNIGGGLSGNQFTAPATGIYLIASNVVLTGAGTALSAPWARLLLYKNGSSFRDSYLFNAVRSDGYCAISGVWVVLLTAGDRLTLYAYQSILSGGVTIAANTSSFFAGALLR